MTKKGGLAIALLLVVTGALRWISPGGSSAPGTPPETEAKTKAVSAKHGNQQPTDGSHGIYAVELEETVREFFGLDHDDLAAIEKKRHHPRARLVLARTASALERPAGRPS
jgi:hypothetical protein